jgi:hypothetical protein
MTRSNPGSDSKRFRETRGETKGDSELDVLLRGAEELVIREFEQQVSHELDGINKKKEERQEALDRVQQLQEAFHELDTNDPALHLVGFEYALAAARELSNIAEPEEVYRQIGDLRKISDSLRRIRAANIETDAIAERVARIEEIYKERLATIKAIIDTMLERVRKQYSGEVTEFEARVESLKGSALFVGIETPQDPETQETRKRILTQEVVEQLLSGYRTDVLEPFFKAVQQMEHLVARAQEILKQRSPDVRETAQLWESIVYLIAKFQNYEPKAYIKPSNTREVLRDIERKAKSLSGDIEPTKARLRLHETAFAANRRLIEDALADHTPEEIEKALEEIKAIRSLGNTGREPYFRNPLAADLVSCALFFGVRVKQFTGDHSSYDRYSTVADETLRDFPFRLLSKKLDAGNLDEYRRRSAFEYLVSVLGTEEEARDEHQAVSGDITRILEHGSDSDFAKRITKRINYNRAAQLAMGEQVDALPQFLAERGWREGRTRVLIPPEGDVRKMNAEFERLVEELSRPRFNAEQALDSRKPEGNFEILTKWQAMDLLRRARRDGAEIITNLEQEVAKGKEKIVEAERSADSIGKEIDRLRAAVEKSETTVKEQEQHIAELQKRILTLDFSLKDTGGIVKRLEGVVGSTVTDLEEALSKKAPMLSGDKELRNAVQNIIDALRKK